LSGVVLGGDSSRCRTTRSRPRHQVRSSSIDGGTHAGKVGRQLILVSGVRPSRSSEGSMERPPLLRCRTVEVVFRRPSAITLPAHSHSGRHPIVELCRHVEDDAGPQPSSKRHALFCYCRWSAALESAAKRRLRARRREGRWGRHASFPSVADIEVEALASPGGVSS